MSIRKQIRGLQLEISPRCGDARSAKDRGVPDPLSPRSHSTNDATREKQIPFTVIP